MMWILELLSTASGATVGYVKVIDLDYADGVAISAVFGTLVAALDAFNNWV